MENQPTIDQTQSSLTTHSGHGAPKGMSPVAVGTLLILVAAGSLAIGVQVGKSQMPENRQVMVQPTLTMGPEISPTLLPASPMVTGVMSPVPSSATVTAKRLTYALPSGWRTVKDATDTFEVGYDPNMSVEFDTENAGKSVNDLSVILSGKWETNPVHKSGYELYVSLEPYNGGSRHTFILQNRTDWDKLSGYHEREYTYNGWSCLVLYGIQISQSNPVNGMCVVSATRAFRFGLGTWTDEETEKVIGAVKLLK
jgi:hypothetical protein